MVKEEFKSELGDDVCLTVEKVCLTVERVEGVDDLPTIDVHFDWGKPRGRSLILTLKEAKKLKKALKKVLKE